MPCIRRNFQTIFTFRRIEAYLICYITGIIIKKCQQTSDVYKRQEQERLQNEMNLAYQVYTQVSQQLQMARAKVQEIDVYKRQFIFSVLMWVLSVFPLL